MTTLRGWCLLAAVVSLLCAAPATAQASGRDDPSPPMGRVARSTAGAVGQRQTRLQSAAGIAPTARVASRIQNRIETRLHTRIDRGYDPLMGGAAAYRAAEREVRSAGRRDETRSAPPARTPRPSSD